MRNEKKLLVDEIIRYLDKSDYAFFTDFRGVTVAEVSDLRKLLRKEDGEFHVIKKSLLKKAMESKSMDPAIADFEGQVALVVGGQNPAGIAKVLADFYKDKKEEKLATRGGVLQGKALTLAEIVQLSELPSIEVLRAQLLSLMNTPATKLLRTMKAVPEGMLNVLQARSKG